MPDEAVKIVCPHCEAINRIPSEKPAVEAKCGRCRNRLFTGQPVQVSAKGFRRHIRHNGIPVLVDFWAEWCGPCRAMAPVFEKMAEEFEPGLRFLKLNTETEAEIAAQYNIRSIPMLILFEKGSIVARQAGAVDAERLRGWIRTNVKPTMNVED